MTRHRIGARFLAATLTLAACTGAPGETAGDDPDDASPSKAGSGTVGGVITTGQTITPAGMQTVLEGRVQGVAFGPEDREVLVLVKGSGNGVSGLWRLGWRDNRLLGQARFPGEQGQGTPGIQGVRLDAARGIPIVSYVGPADASAMTGAAAAPASRPARPPSGPRLAALVDGRLQAITGLLGKGEVGAAAVARGPCPQSGRIAVVPLCQDNALAILDIEKGELLRSAPTGIAPFGAVIDAGGRTAYVTNWAGRKAQEGDETAKAGSRQGADDVVVDARGIASSGTVTKVDVGTGRDTRSIAVGLHPTALAWDETGHRLYVADGNADTITVVDTHTDAVAQTIRLAPFRGRTPGLAPTGLVLSPDGATLYVTLGGINAVAVLEARSGKLRGLIPTAWYPSVMALSADGKTLAVGAMLGIGSGTVTESQSKRSSWMKAGSGYVHNYRGAVNVISVPTEAELGAYTVAVARNVGLPLAAGSREELALSARTGIPARAVPERPGEPSKIEHVVYVVKENRTYDQVLGDIGKGNSDPSLTMYGASITPNHHRLAEQFVLLDNFYATGGNSGDGHQWLTQANETDYAMWGFTGRSYPFEGSDPIAPAAAGFLWTAAQEAGKSVLIFGEYAGIFSPPGFPDRQKNLEAYRVGDDFRGRIEQVAPNRSVDAVLAREYPGYGAIVPDVMRARIFLRRLEEWKRAGKMPNLVLVQLPSDHTGGTRAGTSTPAACLADNDLALGHIVEGLSRSEFWKSMAIFVVEDDAQGGVDHVDGHRTVALAISPYTKRRSIDSTMYAQQSMVKTIELMLGLRPLSVFDLTATAMSACFKGPSETPDLTPYTAALPEQSIYEVNPPPAALQGKAREAALASARMNFKAADAAPSEELNRILWHTAKGWDVPYPGVKTSVFFPMAVDLADAQRERDEDDERR